MDDNDRIANDAALPDDLLPDDPAALARLADQYHRQGKLLPALRLYDRLIDLDRADQAIWLATGDALTDIGEYAQAIAFSLSGNANR